MFEKEAEEIMNNHCDCELLSECLAGIRTRCTDFEESKKLLVEGIEFGYNKAMDNQGYNGNEQREDDTHVEVGRGNGKSQMCLEALVKQEVIKSASTENLLKELKDRGVIRSWYYNGTYHVGNERLNRRFNREGILGLMGVEHDKDTDCTEI